jgi:hypothetical protein
MLAEPILKGLTRLEFIQYLRRPVNLGVLSRSPLAGQLREVTLRGAALRLDPRPPGALGDAVAGLRRWLRAGREPAEASELDALLSGLCSLAIRDCRITGPLPLRAFLVRQSLGGLRRLDLSGTRGELGDPQDLALPHLAGLTDLNLAGNRIGDAGVARLAAGAPSHLLRLDLSDNRLTAESVAQVTRFASLRWVSLRDNDLSAGLPRLLASELLPRLCSLDLRHTGLTDAHALRLAALAPHCPHLSLLDLRGNRLERATRERLREALGPAVRYSRE